MDVYNHSLGELNHGTVFHLLSETQESVPTVPNVYKRRRKTNLLEVLQQHVVYVPSQT